MLAVRWVDDGGLFRSGHPANDQVVVAVRTRGRLLELLLPVLLLGMQAEGDE